MAGEPSLYLVYKDFTTDERNSDSWHGTQAAADAAALAAGVGFSAHQGAVAIPNGWAKGWIYNPTDDTWRTFAASDLDELGQRKHAATVLYAALDGQEYDIGQRMGIPSKVAGRVRISSLILAGRLTQFSPATPTPPRNRSPGQPRC